MFCSEALCFNVRVDHGWSQKKRMRMFYARRESVRSCSSGGFSIVRNYVWSVLFWLDTQMEKEITRDLICERESILETTGLLLLEQCVRIAIL